MIILFKCESYDVQLSLLIFGTAWRGVGQGDLSFLKYVKYVRRLRIDDNTLSSNALDSLKDIESLQEFSVRDTSEDLSVDSLRNFTSSLEALFIVGKKADMNIIYDLNGLKLLSLKMSNLIKIDLCASKNRIKFLIIDYNVNVSNSFKLEMLEFLEIIGQDSKRGVEFDSKNLKYISFVNFKRIYLPELYKCMNLGKITFRNCGIIENISAVSSSTSLKEVAFYGENNLSEGHLTQILANPHIKRLYSDKHGENLRKFMSDNNKEIDFSDDESTIFSNLRKLEWY